MRTSQVLLYFTSREYDKFQVKFAALRCKVATELCVTRLSEKYWRQLQSRKHLETRFEFRALHF